MSELGLPAGPEDFRLSVHSDAPCVRGIDCPSNRDWIELGLKLRTQLNTPSGLHADALMRITLDTSLLAISDGIRVLRGLPPTPAARVDLAAALGARGFRTRSPDDIFEALEILDQTTGGGADFAGDNLLHLLNRWGLTDAAAIARGHPAGAPSFEPSALVGTESRSIQEPDTITGPGDGRSPNRRLRDLAYDTLIPAWARAVETGGARSAGARAAFRRLTAVSDSLQQGRGDRGLSEVVQHLEASDSWTAEADAVLILDRGSRAHGRGAFTAALRTLPAARRALVELGSPLADWARLKEASIAVSVPDWPTVDSLLAPIVTDTSGPPKAVRAASAWALGVALGRRGRTAEAAKSLATASDQFGLMDEYDAVAAIQGIELELYALSGHVERADELLWSSLLTLRHQRSSVWLHNLLSFTSEMARERGFARAALWILRDDVGVVERIGEAQYQAETHRALALTHLELGRIDAARENLAAASAYVRAMTNVTMQERLRADLALGYAELLASDGDPDAEHWFSEALEAYGPQNLPHLALRALIGRAEYRDRLERRSDAVADLVEAGRLARDLAENTASAVERWRLQNSVNGIYERLVDTHLDITPELALQYHRQTYLGTADPPGTYPPQENQTVLEYRVLPERTVIWTTAGQSATARTIIPIGRDSVVDLVSASQQADFARGEQARRSLYRSLVAPALPDIPVESTLVIVPDPTLRPLDFASLVDPQTSAYLVERNPIVVSASGRFPGAELPLDPSVVITGSPNAVAGLSPLPAVRDEIRAVAAAHPNARTLAESSRIDEISVALHSADVLHYAGHALFDPSRPGRTLLPLGATRNVQLQELLPPTGRAPTLIVLSACSTLRSVPGASSALSSAALLASDFGVEAILGTTAPVPDAPTMRLMAAFHGSLARGRPPAEALREAQLAMLRSNVPALADPEVWGAFRLFSP